MPVIYSTISPTGFLKIIEKCNLIYEDSVEIPSPASAVEKLPPGKIGFYVYLFRGGLCVTPLFFGGVIIEYDTRMCQLKPNSISKIIFFDLLCHLTLVDSTLGLFLYYFCIYNSDAWFYFLLLKSSLWFG